jgi:hypothetical protein
MTDAEVRQLFKSRYIANRYFNFERNLTGKKFFYLRRVDLVVFFCREYLKCGRRKIAVKTTLSQYQVAQSYKRLKVPFGYIRKVANRGQI